MSNYNSFPVDINANNFKDEKLIKYRKEITDLIRRGKFPVTYDFGIYSFNSSKTERVLYNSRIEKVLKELSYRNFICNTIPLFQFGGSSGYVVKIDI